MKFALLLAFISSPALGFGLGINVGAPVVGTGGSNPIAYAAPIGWGIVWINGAKDREILISIIPGVGYAKRWQLPHDFFVSLGGVVGYYRSGFFLGPSAGFGWDFLCVGPICLSLQYRHAQGFVPWRSNSQLSIGLVGYTN